MAPIRADEKSAEPANDRSWSDLPGLPQTHSATRVPWHHSHHPEQAELPPEPPDAVSRPMSTWNPGTNRRSCFPYKVQGQQRPLFPPRSFGVLPCRNAARDLETTLENRGQTSKQQARIARLLARSAFRMRTRTDVLRSRVGAFGCNMSSWMENGSPGGKCGTAGP